MSEKLKPAEFEKIIQPLPTKERIALREQSLTASWLESQIDRCRRLMKRDLWVGLTWFAVYSVVWFSTGVGKLSIGVFVLGMIYFIYTIFTTGSYGLNKKRVQVYQQLLEKLKL